MLFLRLGILLIILVVLGWELLLDLHRLLLLLHLVHGLSHHRLLHHGLEHLWLLLPGVHLLLHVLGLLQHSQLILELLNHHVVGLRVGHLLRSSLVHHRLSRLHLHWHLGRLLGIELLLLHGLLHELRLAHHHGLTHLLLLHGHHALSHLLLGFLGLLQGFGVSCHVLQLGVLDSVWC